VGWGERGKRGRVVIDMIERGDRKAREKRRKRRKSKEERVKVKREGGRGRYRVASKGHLEQGPRKQELEQDLELEGGKRIFHQ